MSKLTRFELENKTAFGSAGEASIREVCESLTDRKRPAYTTVQTIVQRLEAKGALKRTRKIGNAFLFAPAITRRSAYRRIVDDLLELFGGSAQPVVAHLLESGKLSLEDLKALEVAEESRKRKKEER
jgi:predicted transcriptional regulator